VFSSFLFQCSCSFSLLNKLIKHVLWCKKEISVSFLRAFIPSASVKHVFSSYSWHNKVYDMLFLKGPSENQILNSYKWNSHIRGSNSYARLFTRISSTLLKFCLLFPFAFPKLVSTRFNFRRLDRSILRVSIFTNIQNSFSRPWDVFHPDLKISETKQ
jgi:hypothetical protein